MAKLKICDNSGTMQPGFCKKKKARLFNVLHYFNDNVI